MEKVLHNIVTIRERKGCTQQFMAENLNMSQAAYSRIESGKHHLRVDLLYQIGIVLNEPVEFFFTYPIVLVPQDKCPHCDFLEKQNQILTEHICLLKTRKKI